MTKKDEVLIKWYADYRNEKEISLMTPLDFRDVIEWMAERQVNNLRKPDVIKSVCRCRKNLKAGAELCEICFPLDAA